MFDGCYCRSDLWTFRSTKLLPEEQKSYRKRSRRTNDLLYVDRAVIKEVKSNKKNSAMAWIGYKEAYDMVTFVD